MTHASTDGLSCTLPTIAIVTPSFNQGEFLEECIDSILSQNYPRLEYVIMDGGSTDNSVEIIRKYEKYLTYWQSQPDGGQYAAINAGFARTSGDVMAWLNSDDRYHDGALMTVAFLLSRYPEVEWLMGCPSFWDREGKIFSIREQVPTYCRADFLEKRYNDPFVQQESTFWRRTLWERAGGRVRDDLDYAGDLELWVRYFRHAGLYTVDALLGGYRSYGDQKAQIGMAAYLAEAEQVIAAEIERAAGEEGPGSCGAPEPLALDVTELAAFQRAAGLPVGSFHRVYQYLRKETMWHRCTSQELRTHATALEEELLLSRTALEQTREHLSAIERSLTRRLVRWIGRLQDSIAGRSNR